MKDVQVGSRTYPGFRLYPMLFDATKTLYGKFGATPVDIDTAAPIIGHASSKSSQFREKIAVMKDFHLIEGRGDIKVTETGRRLTFPETPDEEQEAVIQVITSISLWREFYEKWTKKGEAIPTETFWADLRQITGLPPEEAKRRSDEVRNAYLEDIRYLKVKRSMERTDLEAKPTQPTQGRPELAGGIIAGSTPIMPPDFARLTSDDFVIGVRKDPQVIAYVKAQIDTWLDYVKGQIAGQTITGTAKAKSEDSGKK